MKFELNFSGLIAILIGLVMTIYSITSSLYIWLIGTLTLIISGIVLQFQGENMKEKDNFKPLLFSVLSLLALWVILMLLAWAISVFIIPIIPGSIINNNTTKEQEIPAICSFKCINLNMTYFAENAQKDFCLCLKDNSTIYPIQRSGALQ